MSINGRKTYTLMLVMALLTVAGYFRGDLTIADAITQLGTFGGLATLRHGVANGTRKT